MALWHISNDIYVISRVGINDYELSSSSSCGFLPLRSSACSADINQYINRTTLCGVYAFAAILQIQTSSSRRFSFFKVTISLTFVIASIAGELYFVLMNNRRFLTGRWTESYVASSLAINVVLAVLLESLMR